MRYKAIHACSYVSEKNSRSRFVAKRYILQQKCLNGEIGTCMLGTRCYNF